VRVVLNKGAFDSRKDRGVKAGYLIESKVPKLAKAVQAPTLVLHQRRYRDAAEP
jgi:hypothetical protein